MWSSPRSEPATEVDHYEPVRQRKDGTRLNISLTVSPIRNERGEIVGASKIARDVTERARLIAVASEHAINTEKLGEVGAVVASTLDREAIVQKVTDIATELTRAQFGAFFYNVTDPKSGDVYMLYTLSGAPREALREVSGTRARLRYSRRPSMVKVLCDWTMSLRTHAMEKSAPYHGHAFRSLAGPQLPRGAGEGRGW